MSVEEDHAFPSRAAENEESNGARRPRRGRVGAAVAIVIVIAAVAPAEIREALGLPKRK